MEQGIGQFHIGVGGQRNGLHAGGRYLRRGSVVVPGANAGLAQTPPLPQWMEGMNGTATTHDDDFGGFVGSDPFLMGNGVDDIEETDPNSLDFSMALENLQQQQAAAAAAAASRSMRRHSVTGGPIMMNNSGNNNRGAGNFTMAQARALMMARAAALKKQQQQQQQQQQQRKKAAAAAFLMMQQQRQQLQMQQSSQMLGTHGDEDEDEGNVMYLTTSEDGCHRTVAPPVRQSRRPSLIEQTNPILHDQAIQQKQGPSPNQLQQMMQMMVASSPGVDANGSMMTGSSSMVTPSPPNSLDDSGNARALLSAAFGASDKLLPVETTSSEPDGLMLPFSSRASGGDAANSDMAGRGVELDDELLADDLAMTFDDEDDDDILMGTADSSANKNNGAGKDDDATEDEGFGADFDPFGDEDEITAEPVSSRDQETANSDDGHAASSKLQRQQRYVKSELEPQPTCLSETAEGPREKLSPNAEPISDPDADLRTTVRSTPNMSSTSSLVGKKRRGADVCDAADDNAAANEEDSKDSPASSDEANGAVSDSAKDMASKDGSSSPAPPSRSTTPASKAEDDDGKPIKRPTKRMSISPANSDVEDFSASSPIEGTRSQWSSSSLPSDILLRFESPPPSAQPKSNDLSQALNALNSSAVGDASKGDRNIFSNGGQPASPAMRRLSLPGTNDSQEHQVQGMNLNNSSLVRSGSPNGMNNRPSRRASCLPTCEEEGGALAAASLDGFSSPTRKPEAQHPISLLSGNRVSRRASMSALDLRTDKSVTTPATFWTPPPVGSVATRRVSPSTSDCSSNMSIETSNVMLSPMKGDDDTNRRVACGVPKSGEGLNSLKSNGEPNLNRSQSDVTVLHATGNGDGSGTLRRTISLPVPANDDAEENNAVAGDNLETDDEDLQLVSQIINSDSGETAEDILRDLDDAAKSDVVGMLNEEDDDEFDVFIRSGVVVPQEAPAA